MRKELSDKFPILFVCLSISNPSCHHLFPPVVASCREDNTHRENEDFWRLLPSHLTSQAIASVKQNKNDEVCIGIL